jgi:hypothetical protein
MGKHFRDKHCSFLSESSHPGCTWNILHVIKYHHWRYGKIIYTNKQCAGGSHVAGKQLLFFFLFFFFYMKNSLALARHANLASIIFIFDPSMILLSLPFNYALDVMYEYSCNI